MTLHAMRSLHRLLAGSRLVSVAALLSLLLAVGQQHALLHWLSHATSSTKAQHAGAAEPGKFSCDECVALAAFGASSPTAPWAFSCAELHDPAFAGPAPAGITQALRLAFRARAPPILS